MWNRGQPYAVLGQIERGRHEHQSGIYVEWDEDNIGNKHLAEIVLPERSRDSALARPIIGRVMSAFKIVIFSKSAHTSDSPTTSTNPT